MPDAIPPLQPDVLGGEAPPSAPPDLSSAQLRRLEQLCTELTSERDRLRAELGIAQNERDGYLKSLSSIVGKDYVCPYTDEELLACVDRDPPLRDFITQLKRAAGAAA